MDHKFKATRLSLHHPIKMRSLDYEEEMEWWEIESFNNVVIRKISQAFLPPPGPKKIKSSSEHRKYAHFPPKRHVVLQDRSQQPVLLSQKSIKLVSPGFGDWIIVPRRYRKAPVYGPFMWFLTTGAAQSFLGKPSLLSAIQPSLPSILSSLVDAVEWEEPAPWLERMQVRAGKLQLAAISPNMKVFAMGYTDLSGQAGVGAHSGAGEVHHLGCKKKAEVLSSCPFLFGLSLSPDPSCKLENLNPGCLFYEVDKREVDF